MNNLGRYGQTKNNNPQQRESKDVTNMTVFEILQMQVSRKQDTYYLEVKEDVRKFYCSSFEEKAKK